MRRRCWLRIRPAIGSELDRARTLHTSSDGQAVSILGEREVSFRADQILSTGFTQQLLFSTLVSPLIDEALLEDRVPTLLICGPRGTGKSYTIEGSSRDEALVGLLYNTVSYLMANEAGVVDISCLGFTPSETSCLNLLTPAETAIAVAPLFNTRAYPSVAFPGCGISVGTATDVFDLIRLSRRHAALTSPNSWYHKLWIIDCQIKGQTGRILYVDLAVFPTHKGYDASLTSLLGRIFTDINQGKEEGLPLREHRLLSVLRDSFHPTLGSLATLLCLSEITTQEEVEPCISLLNSLSVPKTWGSGTQQSPARPSSIMMRGSQGMTTSQEVESSGLRDASLQYVTEQIKSSNKIIRGLLDTSRTAMEKPNENVSRLATSNGLAESVRVEDCPDDVLHSAHVAHLEREEKVASILNAVPIPPKITTENPAPDARDVTERTLGLSQLEYIQSLEADLGKRKSQMRQLELLLKESLKQNEAQLTKNEALNKLVGELRARIDESVAAEPVHTNQSRFEELEKALRLKDDKIFSLSGQLTQLKRLLDQAASCQAYADSLNMTIKPTMQNVNDERADALVLELAEREAELEATREAHQETIERLEKAQQAANDHEQTVAELNYYKGLSTERASRIQSLTDETERLRAENTVLSAENTRLQDTLTQTNLQLEEVRLRAESADVLQEQTANLTQRCQDLERRYEAALEEQRTLQREAEARATTIESLSRQVGYLRGIERTLADGTLNGDRPGASSSFTRLSGRVQPMADSLECEF
ncbi:putative Spindle pole protein [Giardia muris]|uniref:Putative Spindle pole protein n=1 Tax=Giardia muris TaxID=5742 RepID=A0A4Z1SYL7_GIAMU|nr:putative Spindle pole protein [Giardia muris]|eukprot:TNJ26763.1 putative Spindle pole protein [Giardia muris]